MRQVRQRLAQQSVMVMDYGGRFVEASARTSLLLVAVMLHSIAAVLVAIDRYLERERKLNDRTHRLRGQSLRREFAQTTEVEPKPLEAVAPAPLLPVEAIQDKKREFQPAAPKPKAVAKTATVRRQPRNVPQNQPTQIETTPVLSRVTKLMASMRVSDDRVRVFVISSELHTSIRTAAESLGLPETIVQSLYPWLLELSAQWNLTSQERSECDYKGLQTILRYVEKHRPQPVLEVAMIEDRDLPPEAYRLLSLLSKHVTLFADEGRRIYDCF